MQRNTSQTKGQKLKICLSVGDNIYYRYYPDTDNDTIDKNKIMLIRAIKPDFNEEIPDKLDFQPVKKAF